MSSLCRKGDTVKLLTIGAEGSGNRLLSRILDTATPAIDRVLCEHAGSDEPHPHTLPHGDEMPNVAGMIEATQPDRVLVIWRDKRVRDVSAVKAGHVDELEQSARESTNALSQLAGITDAYWLVYEALVADPLTQVANLGRWLGVSLTVPETIFDGNARQVADTSAGELVNVGPLLRDLVTQARYVVESGPLDPENPTNYPALAAVLAALDELAA